jgi:hypothetical protein
MLVIHAMVRHHAEDVSQVEILTQQLIEAPEVLVRHRPARSLGVLHKVRSRDVQQVERTDGAGNGESNL